MRAINPENSKPPSNAKEVKIPNSLFAFLYASIVAQEHGEKDLHKFIQRVKNKDQ